jgi:kinesin family protein 5
MGRCLHMVKLDLVFTSIKLGKTHTMMGVTESNELKGLTPRIVDQIFNTIQNASVDLEFTVKVSFMEIYMEKVKDLLNRNL